MNSLFRTINELQRPFIQVQHIHEVLEKALEAPKVILQTLNRFQENMEAVRQFTSFGIDRKHNTVIDVKKEINDVDVIESPNNASQIVTVQPNVYYEHTITVTKECNRPHITEDLQLMENRMTTAITTHIDAFLPQPQELMQTEIKVKVNNHKVFLHYNNQSVPLGTIFNAHGKLLIFLIKENELDTLLSIDRVFAEIYDFRRGATSSRRYQFHDHTRKEKVKIIKNTIKDLQRGEHLRKSGIRIKFTEDAILTSRIVETE